MAQKRKWKTWAKRLLLLGLIVFIIWIVNLIWFKPFKIEHFYDRVFAKALLQSPEITTQLGIPVLYDWTKDELDPASKEANEAYYELFKNEYATLQSYDYENLSEANQLNTDILGWYVKSQMDGEAYSDYEYTVNQMSGVQNSVPDMMVNSHRLKSKGDVKAYISRLSKFKWKFDQVLDELKRKEQLGFLPPTFIVDNVITEMEGFMGTSEGDPVKSNLLFTHFDTSLNGLENLSEEEKREFLQQAATEIEQSVLPSYQQLIDFFKRIKPNTNLDAGSWKFPKGDAYYRQQLKTNTTTDTDPREIHQIGLAEVDRIKAQVWEILRNEGVKDITITLRAAIDTLAKNYPRAYLDTSGENGPQKMLDRYDEILAEINTKTATYFNLLPKAPLVVKRIPTFKEGGTGAYYNAPAKDGSRPGIFFANLASAEANDSVLSLGMKTLSYHEGIPGHHFQLAIQGELEGLPQFRGVGLFPVFTEGWALYTEQLAFEMGLYDNDPIGNIGRLQAELFRSARLVVDTGIHSQKWTRDQAIEYLMENAFMARTGATIEIDRYIVMPGQACAYKIGMLKILELRDRTMTALGANFDIKAFHDVILRDGAIPLDLLEKHVNTFIEEMQ